MHRHFRNTATTVLLIFALAGPAPATAPDFITFESGQVRPLAMTPNGSRLLAVNTPDNRLEVFEILADGLRLEASVPVGMEPVAVAVRSNTEAWVVNHLSDSISIVSLAGAPAVTRTLLVGDEPRDIVFAGSGNARAFVTTAHRGQHRSHPSIAAVPGAGDPKLTTPGIGRADVWVFDAAAPGGGPGGVPLKIVELFGDTPRALAVSYDANTVYAGVFHSGNKTAVVSEGAVCNGFGNSACAGDGITSPNGLAGGQIPGGVPGPSTDVHGAPAPEVGVIVKYDSDTGTWKDTEARNFSNGIRFSLPDYDVFAINATTLTETASYSGVGTVLFNMAVNPASGKLYVSNTESINDVQFEGPGNFGGSTVQGHLTEARITIIDDNGVNPRHLNKHIAYETLPAPAGTALHSLATPTELAFSASGDTVYVAAFGSGRVGVLDTADLESDAFDPATDSANYITVSGGGPSGLVLDEARGQLYVLTRFDNGVSIVDLANGGEQSHILMHNPEPAAVVEGRPFLYDANLTSSNGEASCASCHIYGDMDGLAWDLGNPDGEVKVSPIPINLEFFADNSPGINGTGNPRDFHPMKGPMTTQTLRGMVNSGAMHWRGDRSVGEEGTDAFDSNLSFLHFNEAFPGLVGRAAPLSETQMQKFADFALALTLPPNPIRALDNSLTASEQAGQDFYLGDQRSDGLPFDISGNEDGFTCDGCHTLDPAQGFFGTNGNQSFENERQIIKIAHLRNMYQKVGMFGMPDVPFFNDLDNGHQGDQVRGTGFLHDGSTDTLFRFFNATVFDFSSSGFGDVGLPDMQSRRDMEAYMLAFDNDLAPVVGQQITVDGTAGAETLNRLALLLDRADAPFVSKLLGGETVEADIVVTGLIGSETRAWLRQADGSFASDRALEPALSQEQLLMLADVPGQSLTFLAVPPGSGQRSALDRDRDGVLNGDDVCPAVADSGQADDDADGSGNACDNCTLVSNANQRDTNGDGFGNQCDADLDNDGAVNFTDLGLMKSVFFTDSNADADLNGDGVTNFSDLGLMKTAFFGPPGPSAVAP